MTKYALVGDVDGTNARLALCGTTSGEIPQTKTYSGLGYPSLKAVMHVYLDGHSVNVEDGCTAITCPITDDWVTMTNHAWTFSVAEMRKNLGFNHLEIINDFIAVSMVIPVLKKGHLIQSGGAEPVGDKPIAVYGAGIGFGVARLVHVDKHQVSLSGEGGHMDFAPNSEEEGIILEVLRSEVGYVSTKRVLSGPELVNLYRATVKSDGHLPENLQSKDITARVLEDSCIDRHRAPSLFRVIMGRFGGDPALTLDTFGGVYIAGGIVPRFLDFFKASGFRGGLEGKGRLKAYAQDIPAYLIVHDNPGLLGADAHLRQVLGHILQFINQKPAEPRKLHGFFMPVVYLSDLRHISE